MSNVPVKDISPIEPVTANPGQAVFDIPFTFFAASDIACWVDDVEAVGFGVTGAGSEEGGELTLATPCLGGERVTIERRMVRKRETEIGVGADFKASAINEELSRLAMQIQEVGAKFARVLQLAVHDPAFAGYIPDVAARSNGLLGFDAAGAPCIYLVAGDAGLIALPIPVANGGTGATTQAGARTNLGLGSAAVKDTGTGGGNVPELDADGRLPDSTLPDGAAAAVALSLYNLAR